MTSMRRCLVTSITVTLALFIHNAATTVQYPPVEDEPASVSSLSTNIADVILVSFQKPWNEAHASFARLLGGPITTWRVTDKGLPSYFRRSITRGKKPVFVAPDPGEPFETMHVLQGAERFVCLPWLFVRHHSSIPANVNTRSWPPPSMCDVVGVLGMNATAIQSIFWPLEYSVDYNPGSTAMLAKLRILQRSSEKRLSGQQLVVACRKRWYKRGMLSSCKNAMVRKMFALLKAKNITVKRVNISDYRVMTEGLYANRWNMVLDMVALRSDAIHEFDFPFTFLVHRTFYSRVDAHRVVTLWEVAGESWKLVATTVSLVALVVIFSAIIGEKGWSTLRSVSDTAMFLLAAVLATSAAHPNVVGRASVLRNAILGLWLVAILPLSVYFRSELTSIVTLRRPAYRIDTLRKLEDALDRREVTPCVVGGTVNHVELNGTAGYVSGRSLINKLQLAFARDGHRGLVRENISDCLQCASQRNRVCYNTLEQSRASLKKFRNVRAFVEHVRMEPSGYQTHKFLEVHKPLRRLFLATLEQRVIPLERRKLDYEVAETQFDASSLFVLQVILHAASCLVLMLEILAARFLRRGHQYQER